MHILSKLSIHLFIIFSASAYAEDKELAKVFKEFSADGAIVISSLKGDATYIHNDRRAKLRLSPASTFKITNSLIAIEEKVLKDESEIIKWDGVNREVALWNQDHNLASAFQVSCIWFYQEIAKKVGFEKYEQYLKSMNYGNAKPGPVLTTFWLLNGDLEITPLEQVDFLKNVYQKKLKFSDHSYAVLKKVMLNETGESYRIYAKTGTATTNWQGHGWYLGYIEVEGDVWFFATNIIINGKDRLPVRKELTLAALKAKRIIK